MLAEGPTGDARETMSQGSSGSPVDFLDSATCEAILDGLRDSDGRMPTFSPPGTPPPALDIEATQRDRHTQTRTGAKYTADKASNTFIDVTDAATQVVGRPHLRTSSTQTSPTVVPSQDQSTQDHLRPCQFTAFTQTARLGTYHRGAQTDRSALTIDSATSMAPVLVATTSCRAGAYFNNEVIPPGVTRPRLPWAYTYAQLEALLLSYPTVHPEDFITFGVIHAQPQRGSQCEWGEVAVVLAHMAGGRRLLADAFYVVMRLIQCLARDDPIRAVEKDALVLGERRRSACPSVTGPTPHWPPRMDPSPSRPLHVFLAAALNHPRPRHHLTVRRLPLRDPQWVAADAAAGLHLGPAVPRQGSSILRPTTTT